jgi:hypothetical protein
MASSAAERYVRLGLQLGRHVDGIVDSYYGPADLAAEVDAAPPVDPSRLVTDAEALLAELDEGWLRDQVVGLRAYAGVLAGEAIPYADEVERCYGVRPEYTDEAVFTAAHEQLDELLPGDGSVADRYASWRRSSRVPAEQVESLATAVFDEARSQTRALVELPADEGVEIEIVRDKPWFAYCEYLGDLRSRIAINVDLPMPGLELLVLALHEAYPGHHTEGCCKEVTLVRERGLLEQTIVMVPTPQSIVAEGIATLAPELVLETEAGPALAAVLHDAGIELDLDHALAVERAREACNWSGVNAALLLHDRGHSERDVQVYVERWGLLEREMAQHLIRFLTTPTSRSYILTYAAGRELCRAYVGGDHDRFRRLLTEQVRVRELVEAQAAAG